MNQLAQVKDYIIHPAHYFMHAASAVLVLAASIGVHILLTDIRAERQRKAAHSVLWNNGEVQTNFIALPRTALGRAVPGTIVELGVMDDGVVVWRRRNQ
jgi:hypothetical protein